MNDLEKAKNLLKNKQYAFVAVSKGKIIKTSHNAGNNSGLSKYISGHRYC